MRARGAAAEPRTPTLTAALIRWEVTSLRGCQAGGQAATAMLFSVAVLSLEETTQKHSETSCSPAEAAPTDISPSNKKNSKKMRFSSPRDA